MLATGGILMLMGMGTVFSFLIILIFAMLITSKCLVFINKIFPEALPETVAPKKVKSASSDEEIAIAIAATKVL